MRLWQGRGARRTSMFDFGQFQVAVLIVHARVEDTKVEGKLL